MRGYSTQREAFGAGLLPDWPRNFPDCLPAWCLVVGTPCVSCVMFGVPVLWQGLRLGTSHGPHCASGQVSARPLCLEPTA